MQTVEIVVVKIITTVVIEHGVESVSEVAPIAETLAVQGAARLVMDVMQLPV